MHYVFQVEGMRCAHCERALVEAVRRLEGVESARADHALKRLEVTLAESPSPTFRSDVETTVHEEGFRLVDEESTAPPTR